MPKSGSKKLIESCQTTKKTHGEKGNIWQAGITWLKQIQRERLRTDYTQTKGANTVSYICIPGRKWNTNQGMAVLVAPELALPGGHPQGHSCHLRENFVNHLLKPKLFWRLPYHLSWPPLAATLGQLVNPVWDWWRWRPCQESRLLERVRRLDVQLSNSSSPAPLLSTVLSCCTLPTRSLVIHTILGGRK